MTGSLHTGSPDVTDQARRLYDEVWNAGRYEVADQLFHPDFQYPPAPGLRGPEAKLAAIRRYRTASPDLHIRVDDLVAQGDTVAVRWTISGTDTGGLAGRTPTGRSFSAWGVDILGFREGRIISDWIGVDWLGVFTQLGAIDDPWAH